MSCPRVSCWVLVCLASFQCLTTLVEAGTVTGSPVVGFTTADSSKDHLLLNASPNFVADLSTYVTFTSQVHSLLGVTANDGIADFEHQAADGPDGVHGDIALPYAMVGRHANGENGTVLYKFVVEPGYQTAAGGKVNAAVYFRHDPDSSHGDNAWIGVNSTASIPGGLYYLLNDGDFDKVSMRDRFGGGGGGYASYTGDVSVDIPAGLTEFYVAFSDVLGNSVSSARFAVTSLQINGSLAAIPEPSSLLLFVCATSISIGLRRRSAMALQ